MTTVPEKSFLPTSALPEIIWIRSYFSNCLTSKGPYFILTLGNDYVNSLIPKEDAIYSIRRLELYSSETWRAGNSNPRFNLTYPVRDMI